MVYTWKINKEKKSFWSSHKIVTKSLDWATCGPYIFLLSSELPLPPCRPLPTGMPLSTTAGTPTPLSMPRCACLPSLRRWPQSLLQSRRLWTMITALTASSLSVRKHPPPLRERSVLCAWKGGGYCSLHHHPGYLWPEVWNYEGDFLWSCWIWIWTPGIWPGRTPSMPWGIPDSGLQGTPCHCSPWAVLYAHLPCPKQVCVTKTIEITEVKCDDKIKNKCFNVAKLADATNTVDQKVIIGEPSCEQITLTLPTHSCSKTHALVVHHAPVYHG